MRTRGTHDADIAETAGQLLGAAIDVPSETVKADVHDRVITLSGQVTWDYQRDAAVRAVMYITGVIAVANTITLRQAESEVGDGGQQSSSATPGQPPLTDTRGDRPGQ